MGNLYSSPTEKKVKIIGNKFIHEEEEINKKNIYFNYDKKYNIICEDNEDQLSSLFKKFKEKSKTENLELFFISNGKRLNPKMKINQLDSDQIYVHEEGNMLGGDSFSFRFTDISKQIYEEHNLSISNNAASYRVITQGINIYGICKGKTCKGYNKEVICPLKNKKKYNLLEEKDDLECPVCGGIIIPKTIGFHSCEYKISGKKYEDKEIKPFEFEGKAENKDSIQYYNPSKNGTAIIVELIIEITKDL